MTVSSRSTISARLTIFSTLFVTAAMIVASVILWLIVAGVVREQIDQRLDTQIDALRGTLMVDPEGKLTLGASLDGPPFDRVGSGWYWQVNGSGAPLVSLSLGGRTIDSPPRPIPGRHRPAAGEPRRQAEPADNGGAELHIRFAGARIDGRAMEILASAPQTALNDPARRALLWLVPAMITLGLILVAGTVLQVRYGLRPVRKLTADIADVGEGRRDALPEADAEELRPVTAEINRLVEANARRLADTRLHFANLAHGLKTPVASLLLALDERNDPDRGMRRLVDRIEERIRHHLASARKTTTGAGMGATTALDASLADLVQVLSRIHAERGLHIDWALPKGLTVACASDDLDEILGNLVDNAFKWARTRIRISATAEGRTVVIDISDDGPGISEERIATAFLPGIRIDESVQGDGFGLTIARELAELYGGSIVLLNRPEGGLKVVLTLPRAALSPDVGIGN